MKQVKTIFIIMFTMTLLTSCWGLTFNARTPSQYTEADKVIGSYYGSTQDVILREFRKPDWTDKRFGSTYYIYQWKSSDVVVAFFVLPIPVAGERTAVDTYCLILEFDENNKLINHESITQSVPSVHEHDCKDIYSKYIRQIEKLGEWYSRAVSGEADAQIRIGEIYSIGLYGIEKNLSCAYFWYSHAQANGSAKASDLLTNIAEKMNTLESDEANRMLDIPQRDYCVSDLFIKAQKLND
jgi:hypothetical protein